MSRSISSSPVASTRAPTSVDASPSDWVSVTQASADGTGETVLMVAGEQTWIDDSKYNVWRTWVLNHLIHHRAQLGVYLRLLDKKIPGAYGPSADEM